VASLIPRSSRRRPTGMTRRAIERAVRRADMAHLRGDVDDRTGFGRGDELAHDSLTHRRRKWQPCLVDLLAQAKSAGSPSREPRVNFRDYIR
jgi:hypothetical protein